MTNSKDEEIMFLKYQLNFAKIGFDALERDVAILREQLDNEIKRNKELSIFSSNRCVSFMNQIVNVRHTSLRSIQFFEKVEKIVDEFIRGK